MTRDDVSTLLRDAAPAPTDETDVRALWSRGRRLRARRRLGQGVAAIAVVAVLGGAAAFLPDRSETTLRFGDEPVPENVELAARVPARPAPRDQGVDYERVAQGGAGEERWAVLAQRSVMLAGFDVRVEGAGDGTSVVLPLPDEGLSAAAKDTGHSTWVMALLSEPAVAARVRLSTGETVRTEGFETAAGVRMAVARVRGERDAEDDAVGVDWVEAVDVSGQRLVRLSGDALAPPEVGLPLESQFEHVADGEHAGDPWTLEINVAGDHLPDEWTAVQPRLTLKRYGATETKSWQVGGSPGAPFRPRLFDADEEPLIVSGWAPDDARSVRVHQADGEVVEAPVRRPSGSPFAFYVALVPREDEHPTAGIERVEAVGADGGTLAGWDGPR